MALFYAESPRDVLALTGRDRTSFLQGMVTNDVLTLLPGQSCYAFHLDATGHVLADMYVLCLEDKLLLVTESGMGEILNNLLEHYLVMERAKITSVNYNHYLFLSTISPFVPRDPLHHPAAGYPAKEGSEALGEMEIDSLRYSHPLGFGLLTEEPLETLTGYQQISADALEALRIEAGVPRFGIDIDKRVLAPETGQATRAIHYKKGCYVGQEIVARIDARGHTNRRLVRLALPAPVPPETPLLLEGKEVGRVTSSVPAPEGAIALGYLRHEHTVPGTVLDKGVVR
jgi:tRNA-modifying protein YgfZ